MTGKKCKNMTLSGMAATVFLAASMPLCAEILFNYQHPANYGEFGKQEEFAGKGRFFATTDFADTGFESGGLLCGRTIEKAGILPSLQKPWMGDGSRTLFGIRFNYPIPPNYPGQFERFTNGIPLFDRAEISWNAEAPLLNSWSVCIENAEGKLVKINTDSAKTIYPRDRTTINFTPTTIRAFYVGLKGREDGLENFPSVRDIKLYILADRNHSLTNNIVAASDLYQAYFSVTSPGMIDRLIPSTEVIWAGFAEIPYRWMTPFIKYNGTNLFPVKKEYPVKTNSSGQSDCLEYTLSFDVPGSEPVQLAVKAAFRKTAEKSVEFGMRADKLPDGASIGYQFYGPEAVFGALADAAKDLSGQPISVRTPVGKMEFHLSGADRLNLSRAEGLARAEDWFGNTVKWIRLETVASGPEMDLAISLPIGSSGQPQPETLNYTWRPSLANEGDGALAPFKMSDLELLEEIDCGNPDDPHKCYDSTNDPAVAALRKKYGDKLKPFSDQDNPYGFLAFLDNPGAGAVPLETINGKSCRAIPDKLGSYFRYDLNIKLKPRTPYLVVVEHAFDKTRRGEFHSICLDEKTEDLVYSRGLYGGFESEPDPENGFRTEFVLCNFRGLSFPGVRGIKNTKDSIVFANKMHSGPWIKVPGLAVKNIRIYRVKNMPELPDISGLSPAVEQQRSLTMWTEMDRGPNALYLFQYPKLLGYNVIWSHTREFWGGRWWGPPQPSWHPGSLAGNDLLFAAAEKQGIAVNIHLGELLHLGFENTDYDSFTAWPYMGERIPIKPTMEELDHMAGALKIIMPILAKYRSLRDVSTHFWPDSVFTRRNIEDFRAATGAKLVPSPSASENVQSLLNGGPEMLRQWRQWACAERFKFNGWLLAEVRKYRPDLFVTLLRYWDHGAGLVEPCLGRDMIPGADRQKFASAGITNMVDYLRFFGIAPELYAGNSGFMLEMEAYSVLRSGREVPDYFETDWFREIRKGFNRGGLGLMLHAATLEASVPLQYYHCPYVVPKTEFRKGLVRAFVYGNPRNISIGSYNEPWGARLGDFREFAVAYRLLPFVEPENYGGKITDTASQAVIGKYGSRYGLVNNGDKDTMVELDLPAGMAAASDLSEGVLTKLETLKNKDGKPTVKIAMKPWSLKVLEIK